MSFPNIPNITATISVSAGQALSLLVASVALEELALAHVINAEAEKIQFVLGTLSTNQVLSPNSISLADLLAINKSVLNSLQAVAQTEVLLQNKLSTVLAYSGITPK